MITNEFSKLQTLWLNNLTSGDFQQGQDALITTIHEYKDIVEVTEQNDKGEITNLSDFRFCCLGVATYTKDPTSNSLKRVQGHLEAIDIDAYQFYSASGSLAPACFIKTPKYPKATVKNLTQLNDQSKLSFNEIAMILRQHPGLFFRNFTNPRTTIDLTQLIKDCRS